VTSDPSLCDIAVYSCYGDFGSLRYTQHATRILFLGENVRPCFSEFDFSLTFDADSYLGRNIHLPLWLLEIDWFNKQYIDRRTQPLANFTRPVFLDLVNRKPWVVYVGNNHEPKRMSLISTLRSSGIQVDCYGSQSRPVNNKAQLLSTYFGTIVMENSYYPTYHTEKLLQAYSHVPYLFYWGAPLPAFFQSASHIYHIVNSSDTEFIDLFRRALDSTSAKLTKRPLLIESQVNQLFHSVHQSLRDKLKFLMI